MSLEVEFLHWVLIVMLAIAVVLMVASALGAAGPMPPPGLLPEGIAAWAKPIAPEAARPFFPESPPVRRMPTAEAAAQLAAILTDHQAGRASDALAGWQRLELPEATAHWREIARGVAYLQLGDIDRAEWHLLASRQLAPAHPAVAYFLGVLRLEQARRIMQVPDQRERPDTLVAYRAQQPQLQSREMPLREEKLHQEMLAVAELEHALIQSRMLALTEPLLATDHEIDEAVVVPTAGDLLTALGADRLAARAHHLLFGIQLRHGQLTEAEFHLDQAAAAGLPVLYGYQDLAMASAAQGMNDAALRNFGKGLGYDYPPLAAAVAWFK
jgi:hypothetical protein